LIGTAVFFAVMTLLTARAASVEELLILRFIAGIGLGSTLPNATPLVGEYSPRRLRIPMMMILTGAGFTSGAAIGGFVAAWLIPAFGWRSVFYIGGSVPLVIALLMYFWLPESMQFMVLRNKSKEKLREWLKHIDPTISTSANTEYVVHEEARGGVPVIHLLREGRATVTILLWVVNFMNLLNLYSLSSWLPTVIRNAGYSTSSAVLISTMLQIGGIA
jgi:AAHS family 4-hydroxybenzoate transporter-like MFS transporter